MAQPVAGMRRSRVWMLMVLLLVSAVAGFAAWRFVRGRQAAAHAQTGTRWVLPQNRVVKTLVNATGIVRLKTGAEVRVGAQVSGIVRRLFVTVGSTVTQGEVIAEIDSRPIEARV